MTVDLVIFDCDGVLVDTEGVTNRAISANLGRYGFEITPEECFGLFVGGTIQSARDEARRRGAPLPDTWVDEMYAEIFAALEQGVEVFPGLFDLLDLLDAKGIATCIASNGPPRKMAISLTPSGLHDRFAGRIYSAYTHGPAKPDPAMLHHAMRDHGVAAARCAMIDDSLAGILAAQAAGVQAIGYDTLGTPGRLRVNGAKVATRHDEIPALLGLA